LLALLRSREVQAIFELALHVVVLDEDPSESCYASHR